MTASHLPSCRWVHYIRLLYTCQLPLLYHEFLHQACFFLVRLALQVEDEVAACLRIGQPLHHLLIAKVIPLLKWLLEHILEHGWIYLKVKACINLITGFNYVLLNTKLLIELRVINLCHVQVSLFKWNV